MAQTKTQSATSVDGHVAQQWKHSAAYGQQFAFPQRQFAAARRDRQRVAAERKSDQLHVSRRAQREQPDASLGLDPGAQEEVFCLAAVDATGSQGPCPASATPSGRRSARPARRLIRPASRSGRSPRRRRTPALIGTAAAAGHRGRHGARAARMLVAAGRVARNASCPGRGGALKSVVKRGAGGRQGDREGRLPDGGRGRQHGSADGDAGTTETHRSRSCCTASRIAAPGAAEVTGIGWGAA